ncbi:MAG: magnesium chelatase domain-containing protein, partial [Hymenobacter sp.]
PPCPRGQGGRVHQRGPGPVPGSGGEQRVLVAVHASGHDPAVPADLPKSGPHFDLSIAVAVLAASGKIPLPSLERWCSSASSPSTAGSGRCPACCR